jgi:hypothetical protein
VFSGVVAQRKHIFQAAFKKVVRGGEEFFQRECRIKDLDHPFVVKFHGSYVDGSDR